MSLLQHLLATPSAQGIVTSGLVMHLDAGNAASYPGTGSTWTDLSGNGNNATLVNAPIYSSTNGGQIAFNGSTQFATMPRSVADSFSLELWINTTSSGGSSSGEWWNGLAILDADVSGSGNDFGLAIGAGRLMFGTGNPDSTLKTTSTYNSGSWMQIVATRNNTTGARQIFVNGALVVSDTASTQSLNAATQMALARFQSASVGFLACNVAIVRACNIAFSADQVTQNFNANRGRFGL